MISGPNDGLGLPVELAVSLLSDPASYRDSPSRVDVVQTHTSWVFLTDRLAYKLKKPIRYDSIDFRALEARRANCIEEVRLNRRLAPDTYLGVVALTREEDATLALEGDGEPLEWLVKMRRLPAERMLDHLLRAGAATEAELRAIAQVLSRFYARSPAVPLSGAEYCERLAEDVVDNLRHLGGSPGGLPDNRVRAVHRVLLDVLDADAALFAGRAAGGRIVEGHGDLRPEHICLEDPPVIFDCLEFDVRLRLLDCVDELAFLAMECERIGAPQAGPVVLAAYAQAARDRPPERLVLFYKAFRACLWAKLAIWRTREPEEPCPPKWEQRATEYLRLAERYCLALQH
jgi:uncharacterized protein